MANCSVCGAKIGLLTTFEGGLCNDCNQQRRKNHINLAEETWQQNIESAKKEGQINAIMLTTETAPNLNIVERLDIVTAQAAFEINNFKDILVGFMNPVKGRSSELEKQLDILKERALYGLKEKAHDSSANAVVAIDIDISTVTVGQISMLMLVASGTAVVIEE